VATDGRATAVPEHRTEPPQPGALLTVTEADFVLDRPPASVTVSVTV